MSYSKFAYRNLKIDQPSLKAGDPLGVDVDVANTSGPEGDDVVELYLVPPSGPGNPLRALRGFQRVHVAKGQTAHVHVALTPRDLSFVSPEGDRLIAAGKYEVAVGGWPACRVGQRNGEQLFHHHRTAEVAGVSEAERECIWAVRRPRRVVVLSLLASFCACPACATVTDVSVEPAIKLMQAGQFHDAELMLRGMARQYPKNAQVHSTLGVALAQQGNLTAAVGEYRASLVVAPHQYPVEMLLGMAEFKQGHFKQAIPALKAAKDGLPKDPRPAVLLGMSYFGDRQYGEAVPYLQNASAAEPANLELRNVLAQSCLWSHQFECAQKQFESILAADPERLPGAHASRSGAGRHGKDR